jgi:hypothetical protein
MESLEGMRRIDGQYDACCSKDEESDGFVRALSKDVGDMLLASAHRCMSC